ncbi:CRISPR-associated endonuclease Cas1 [Flavobacterium davisii]|uniref:CRISPR-associated endonuclease Cas1 n=1 Tax=Flavobacterium davisii TaxID=2906077 RepID=A0ABW8PRS6_9FLAO|nr:MULTISPECIES: CRISPR-associated endonuclease Cas1 [Flavobacterium]
MANINYAKKTVLIENKCFIVTKNNQLHIKSEERENALPIEDIGFIILDNPEIYISIPAINLLIQHNSAVIICHKNHLPNGMFLNLESCHIQLRHLGLLLIFLILEG